MFQAHLKTGLYFILLDDLGTMPDISPLSYNAAGEKVLKYSSIFTLDQLIYVCRRTQNFIYHPILTHWHIKEVSVIASCV